MEVHLPCPPLAEWLARRWGDARVGAWEPAQAPRRLRPHLSKWPLVSEQSLADDRAPEQLDALMFGVSLERPELPEACLGALRPGAHTIELALPRLRPVRALLGLERRPLERAAAGQARALAWLGRGYCEVEQWESVDPPGVLVTIARVR